jgi:hypothetical protein
MPDEDDEPKHHLRDVYPTKYYRDEGFVETKLEINGVDLDEIVEFYLIHHAELDFDEIEIVNNRPMNIWLYALCRKYVENEDEATDNGAEASIAGEYDDNPTG